MTSQCTIKYERPWAFLRVGLALLVVWQVVALFSNVEDLFGLKGIVCAESQHLIGPYSPKLSGLIDLLRRLGADEGITLKCIWICMGVSASAMAMGWYTRITASLTWLLHVMFMGTGEASIYGADELLNIGLFYTMLSPAGRLWSLDRTAGRSVSEIVPGRLMLMTLQIHLCVVYVTSGIAKASGSQWLNGEAVYRALCHSDLASFDFCWLAAYAPILRLATWIALALELLYGALVIFPATKRWCVISTIGMHCGIAIALNLWYFSAIMILLNVGAWLAVPGDCPNDLDKQNTGSRDRQNGGLANT